jgi:putative ABC transport system permease protein
VLRNYFIVAIRNLLRHPGYSLINIVGLAIGLTCVILIGLFVQHEFGFDRQHPKVDRIYRVLQEFQSSRGSSTVSEEVSGALAPIIQTEFPEVELAVRVVRKGVWGRVGDKVFNHVLCLTESPFFELFNFPLVKGNPEIVFKSPGSVLITQEMAQKFFGQTDPIGRVLSIEDEQYQGDYIVQGILKDLPETSSFNFDFLVSPKSVSRVTWQWDGWLRSGLAEVAVYIRLRPDASVASVEQKMLNAMRRNLGDEIANRNRYHLQPLTRAYLHSKADNGLVSTTFVAIVKRYGDIQYVRMSMLVAGFILIIACVNFTNLATAQSVSRAREVGMRKVVGANRRQLISQFLGEAVFLSGIAFLLSLALVELALPLFNNLVERRLTLNIGDNKAFFLGLISLAIGTGVLAGSYPAVFLSAIQPASVLKASQKSSTRGGWLRKGLVVFQFAISIFLIVATLVIHRQLEYVRTKDLGFDRDHIVILPIFWMARNDPSLGPNGINLKDRYQEIKQAFLRHPNVLKAATSRFYLQEWTARDDFQPEGITEPWNVRIFSVDEDFFDTHDIPFVAGLPFSKAYAGSNERDRWQKGVEEQFIINEAAVRQLRWKEPVGKLIQWSKRTKGKVIGVVKNFHVQTLHTEVEPVIFTSDHWNMKLLHLKIRGKNVPETLAFLETVWKRYLPSRPFTYVFLDEKLDSFYKAERKQGKVFQTFALIAILVACLGLFGLASFTAEQKTKEIGIRKVLGASESQLILMLSGEFTRLVLIANVIAWPTAYYAMNQWLQNFVYRVNLKADVFLLGGTLAFGIALATVSYQAMKAARANPVDALRYE